MPDTTQCRFCPFLSCSPTSRLTHELCYHAREFVCPASGCDCDLASIVEQHLSAHRFEDVAFSEEYDEVNVSQEYVEPLFALAQEPDVGLSEEELRPIESEKALKTADGIICGLEELLGAAEQDPLEDESDVVVVGIEEAPSDPETGEHVKFLVATFDQLAYPEDCRPGNLRKSRPDRKTGVLCALCSLPFATKPAMLRHMACVHGDKDHHKFGCSYCSVAYHRRSSLIDHILRRSAGLKFRCRRGNCRDVFRTREDRSRHVFECHPVLKCEHCPREFTVPETFKTHMDKFHGETEEILECRMCSETFTHRHERVLHERRCRLDARTVDEKRSFSAVIIGDKRVRGDVTRCRHCRIGFNEEWLLVAHEEQFHVPLKESQQWEHKCFHCFATFNKSVEIAAHVKTHAAKPGYTCSECDKAFFSRGGLFGHKKSAHAGRQFACSHCDAKFTQKVSMMEHASKQHTGQPMYKCGKCEEKFFHGYRLYAHKKKCDGRE